MSFTGSKAYNFIQQELSSFNKNLDHHTESKKF